MNTATIINDALPVGQHVRSTLLKSRVITKTVNHQSHDDYNFCSLWCDCINEYRKPAWGDNESKIETQLNKMGFC